MKFIRSASTTRRAKRSMQYYRVWIYSCNGVLGITSVIFIIFAGFVLTDVRLSLLGGVELYHPTFLYAYVALLLQCGVLQIIGCLGAKRLSHKLLSIYWILLLVLTIGDVVVGLVWVFKLDKVKLNLRPILTREFILKYSTDEVFTNTWNVLQSEEHCCGVDGPLDYDKLTQQVQSQQHSSSNRNSSLIIDVESNLLSLPQSCCIAIYDPVSVNRGGGVLDSLNQTHRGSHDPDEKEFSGSYDGLYNEDHGGGGGWDDRRSDNVTNQFTLENTTNATSSESSGISDLNKSTSHLAHIHSVDDLLLNDNPQSLGDYSNPSELPQQDVIVQTFPHDLEGGRNTIHRRLEEKHRMRHENHRMKGSTHPENESSNNDFTINETTLDESSGVSQGEIKNRTKLKPKTQKSLPTFSFPTKSHPTPEPEMTEQLPVPFTCQRHLKVRNQEKGQKDTYESNHDNKESLGASSYWKLNTEIGRVAVSPEADSDIEEVSSDVETNNIDDLGDEKNNDEQQHSVSRSLWRSREFQESSRDDRNRRKRRHSPVSSKSVTGATPPNFKPLAGSNLFSFLHASAFPITTEDEDNRNSNGNTGTGTQHHPGRKASEIQTAYYFSSTFHTNSFNASLAKRFQVGGGCGVKLIQWVDHVSGILFILGFCIIGFVKGAFLVILRTEIREMISKIQLLEAENPGSPSRSDNKLKDHRLHHVSHPLLAHPHRASTVSANAYNAALPTIKSPDGPSGPNRFSKSYQMRRHSNIIGDRSSQHSQETVNMTLLVTNSGNNHSGPCSSGGCNPTQSEPKQEKGRSNPNLSNFFLSRDDYDPVSMSIPNTAKYLRRSSTCSAQGPGYSGAGYSYGHDADPRPGPSSRSYHHETAHHQIYHQHCTHGHHIRPRLYTRNMSIGAVVHNTGGTGWTSATAPSTFRGGESAGGSGNCSFSSRDENEILSVSMDNVVEGESQREHPPSDDDKEKERRDAEIRDWAASTTCTELIEGGGDAAETTPPTVVTLSLGDYTKADGFNHSSDSAESNGGGGRNGNNNVDIQSLPRSYLGTAV